MESFLKNSKTISSSDKEQKKKKKICERKNDFYFCATQLKEKFLYRAVIKIGTVFICDYHETLLP